MYVIVVVLPKRSVIAITFPTFIPDPSTVIGLRRFHSLRQLVIHENLDIPHVTFVEAHRHALSDTQ